MISVIMPRTAMPNASPYARRTIELCCLAALFGTFIVLKLTYLTITTGDQGVYYYASWLWAQGIIPYRDFFISHSPIQLLLSTIIILAMGVRFTVLDLLPSLLGMLSAFTVFTLVRRSMGSTAALLACALFLFSYAHLVHSSHFTGVNVALLFLLLGTLLFVQKKMTCAGLVLAIAFLSGAYTAPAILALFLVGWMEKTPLKKLTIAILGSSALLHGVFWLMAGRAFMDQVYFYHLAKTSNVDFFAGKIAVLNLVATKNALLLALFLCSIPFFFGALRAWQRGSLDLPKDSLLLVRLSLIILAAYTLFFLFVGQIFSHYFLFTIPFAVIAVTFLLMQLQQYMSRLNGIPPLLFVLTILTLHSVIAVWMYAENRDRKQFEGLEEIVTYLSSTLQPHETIYGDFAIVPTLSLLSGRAIAAAEVDSSIMRFVSGNSSLPDILQSIEEDDVQAVITRPYRGIAIYPPFRKYLEKNYRLDRKFNEDDPAREIHIWLRTEFF